MAQVKERGIGGLINTLAEGKTGAERDRRVAERFANEVAPVLNETEGDSGKKAREAFFKNFSLREAYVACTGDFPRMGHVKESAINSSAFSIITSAALSAKVIEGYDAVQGLIGDMLVTPFNSTLIADLFPGFDSVSGIADVAEAAKYPDVTIGEKAVGDTTFSKRGAMVQITEEAILFDQTGQLLLRANAIGREIRLDREKAIVKGVLDQTNFRCYYPVVGGSPTQTTLFDTDQTVASNALVDYTDIEKAALQFLTCAVDSNSNPILDAAVAPYVVLVPKALEWTARNIANGTQIRVDTNSGALTTLGPNPVSVEVMTSPILDGISTSTWYMAGNGGFKRQFIEKIHMPLQVVPVPAAEINAVSNDIVGGVRARYKSKVFALDNKFVVKCTA